MEPALHAGTDLVFQKSTAKCLKINTPSRKLFERSPITDRLDPQKDKYFQAMMFAMLPRCLRSKGGPTRCPGSYRCATFCHHGLCHASSSSSSKSWFQNTSFHVILRPGLGHASSSSSSKSWLKKTPFHVIWRSSLGHASSLSTFQALLNQPSLITS